MSGFNQYPLNDFDFDFAAMEPINFPEFSTVLSTSSGPSTFNFSPLNHFLIGDPASKMMQEEVLKVNSLESSIDPSVLTVFDTALDRFPPLPSFELTKAPIFDVLTGAEWQLMGNKQTSIDPNLLNPLDATLGPRPPFASGSYTYSSSPPPINMSTKPRTGATPTFLPALKGRPPILLPPKILGPSLLQPYKRPQKSSQPPLPNIATKPNRRVTFEPATGSKRKAQKLVPGEDSEDSDSSPPAPSEEQRQIAKIAHALLLKREREVPLGEGSDGTNSSSTSLPEPSVKSPRVRRNVVTAGASKRNAREPTPEEAVNYDSDTSLSSASPSSSSEECEEESNVEEDKPTSTRKANVSTKRGAIPKRRKVVQKATTAKKVPKGLEIEMVGW
ncbi:MAG: hypothetical protein Q9170_000689 [Blastenia crenularia]